jgi:CRISPR-associated protein Cmr3
MADGNPCLRLALEPIDSLFFRDAKPFEAATRGESGLPTPQTLTGALRTLLLERHQVDFAQLGEQMKGGASFAQALAAVAPHAEGVAALKVRGPWFTLKGEVLVPAPASLRREKTSENLVRLDPLKKILPGWQPQRSEMRPLWRYGRESTEAADGFLKLSGLRCFLEGETPEADELVPHSALYARDNRTGIGVDPSRNTAAESLIYAISLLALKRDAGLCAEVRGPVAVLKLLEGEQVLMKFGGEGRHVAIRAEERGVDWPQLRPEPDKGRLVLLTTPAWFNGWKPPDLEPVAATVGGYQAVSGWDLAKGGPKPNRFMVPAGSVYFLSPGAKVSDALVNNEEDAALGWGCFTEGNWSYV